MNTSRTMAQADGDEGTGVTPSGLTPEDMAGLAERRRMARQRALRRMRRSRAFSMIELLIVIQVVMILAGMALPSLKTTRKQAYETNAVMTLRQLSDAQELYRPRQSPPTYANGFEQLSQAGLIDSSLTSSDDKSFIERSGYRFMVWKDPDQNSYSFMAIASVQGGTGDRSFYVDESGVIRMAPDASISAVSPPLQ